MADKRFSIITKNFDQCLVCGTYLNIHKHEVMFGNGKRQLSIKYGLVVPLCGRHHNMSNEGVHYNRILDLKLKQQAQKAFEYKYPDLDFIKIFHKNYL